MSKSKMIYLGVFLLTALGGLNLFYYLNKTVLVESSLKPSKNGCRLRVNTDSPIADDEFLARQNRQIYGYSKEVPLEVAIKKFNEEIRCFPQYDEFPELTEDEVIASLIHFDSHNDQANHTEARREERKKIIIDRVLPKGSLLEFSMGSCQNFSRFSKDLCAKGLKINLIFNLDKKEDEKIRTKDEDIFIVRKTFLKVQPRQ